MLVLTRKVDERINIGDDIEVQVIEVKGGKVRLGIVAPGHIPIYRQEIYEKIQEQNIESSRGDQRDISKAAEFLKLRSLEEEKSDH